MNWYLFFGYAVFWTLIFLYILYLHRKQKDLNRELETLANSIEDH